MIAFPIVEESCIAGMWFGLKLSDASCRRVFSYHLDRQVLMETSTSALRALLIYPKKECIVCVQLESQDMTHVSQ